MKHSEAIKQFNQEEQDVIKRYLTLVQFGAPIKPDSISQQAKKLGISRQALSQRIKRKNKKNA